MGKKTHPSRRFLISTAMSGMAFAPLGVSSLASATEALSVRLAHHPDKTRFVVDLSDDLPFSYFTLANPYRLVIDLPEIDWNSGAPLQQGTGVVKTFRYGLYKPGSSRIVLDLSGPAEVRKAFKLASTGVTPWRLVFDLAPTSQAGFMGTQGIASRVGPYKPGSSTHIAKAETVPTTTVEDTSAPARKPQVAQARRKPIIVLDPGHGGVDPGAIGVSGVYEKNITLAAAREMKAYLEATGRYKVKLTRSRDVSVKLRQRKEFARRAQADLFISLHADSIGSKNIKGLSVYTLSETASDREAALLAERENKADMIIGVDLTDEADEVRGILIDLAQRDTMNVSARAAATFIRELGRDVRLLRNTHRFAGFAVLKAADVPSILVEMGYLSNRQEERLLRQPSYRKTLIKAMGRAIDSHFSEVQQAALP